MIRLRPVVPLLVASTLALLLPGCLDNATVQCAVGTVRCGDTCVGTQTDSKNCGSCGSACNLGNVCVAGSCVCPPGAVSCGGACTVLAGDPANCGACGNSCGAGNVCSNGSCFVCTAPDGGNPAECQQTALLAGCIDAPAGGVRQVNLDTTGHVQVGPLVTPAGATFPDALGFLGDNLLYSDNDSASILELPLTDLSLKSAETLPLTTPTTGSTAGTTQVLTEARGTGSRVYVMASSINTLRIYDSALPPDAGSIALAGGGVGTLGLTVVGGFAFDLGSFPEPFARLNDGTNNAVFVPLNVGDSVTRLDVSNPVNPTEADSYDLRAVTGALPPLADGGTFAASATQAISRNGKVYVALNVLRFHNFPDIQVDYGPGTVGVIDPTKTGAAALTSLAPGAGCQNVEWLAAIPATGGDQMLVSCAGARTYNPDFSVQSVANTSLVLLGANDQPVASWIPGNAPDAGGVNPPSVGRAVPIGSKVYVADETTSRLYVVELVNNAFVERVGYADGGTPPNVCQNFLVDLKPAPQP